MINQLSSDVLVYIEHILDQAKNGITITDPNQEDNPIIYVNKAFENMFGYSSEDVVGKNCRFLQGEDRNQVSIDKLREAIRTKEAVTVIVRNYTKSGVLKYNEITVSPIFDGGGVLKYFLGVQKDVTKEQELLRQLQNLSLQMCMDKSL
jgi:PAS domain S-box-containing protein